MTANRFLLAGLPAAIMILATIAMPSVELWLAAFGKTAQAKLLLGRVGLALPYVIAAAIGTMFLFAANGAANIKTAGWSVFAGSTAAADWGRMLRSFEETDGNGPKGGLAVDSRSILVLLPNS